MQRWHYIDRGDARLACADYGGEGMLVMLLHGLCGHSGEWHDTASRLFGSYRVVAPDARGHGRSEPHPNDVSRSAFVQDAARWVEYFDSGRAAVVGQSLGGHTAFLVAARRPELVDRLVVAEATPEPSPEAAEAVRRWLDSWPVPFPSREAALDFFGGESLWARAWVEGLDEAEDGLRPRFDAAVMLDSLRELAENSYWSEWASITCPTLVVRGEEGEAAAITQRMVATLPHASLAEIPKAGHDLHLENADAWREALTSFLAPSAS